MSSKSDYLITNLKTVSTNVLAVAAFLVAFPTAVTSYDYQTNKSWRLTSEILGNSYTFWDWVIFICAVLVTLVSMAYLLTTIVGLVECAIDKLFGVKPKKAKK